MSEAKTVGGGLRRLRRYDVDWLRVGAFGLLIVYHICLLYVDWPYHVKSRHQSQLLKLPMAFLTQWRLPLMFLVSGVAVSFLLRSAGTARFVALRTWRLLLPLAFGVAVIVPLQPYYQALQAGQLEPGLGTFLVSYYDPRTRVFREYFTWNHLWYVFYLWLYTLVLVAARPLLDRLPLARAAAFLRSWMLLVAPALPLAIWELLLRERFPSNKALLGDWYNHALYFTVFLYGYWLGDTEALWRRVAAARRLALGAAITAFLGLLVLATELVVPTTARVLTLSHALYALDSWAWLLAIVGYAHVYLNRPSRSLARLNEAVYPVYILHQTILITAAYYLVPLELPAPVEMALLALATFGGSVLLHELVIRRTRWLRPLFGLKWLPPAPTRITVPAHVAPAFVSSRLGLDARERRASERLPPVP